MPPQWRFWSPMRCAALPVMKTVRLPCVAVQVLVPRHAGLVTEPPLAWHRLADYACARMRCRASSTNDASQTRSEMRDSIQFGCHAEEV